MQTTEPFTESFRNNYKVAVHGREAVITLFERDLKNSPLLMGQLWTLSGCRLLCHCRKNQDCHGNVIIRQFGSIYSSAHDSGVMAKASITDVLNMAEVREAPESDDGSTAHEDSMPRGPPLLVSGYCTREFCDGQTLASPGRWPVESRRYPDRPEWMNVVEMITEFSRFGTMELLVNQAMGRVKESPFPHEAVVSLKTRIIDQLERSGIPLARHQEDRTDTPVDFRFMDQLLRAAQDPDRGIGKFARGVRVGPGARLPRLPALYRPKRKWKLLAKKILTDIWMKLMIPKQYGDPITLRLTSSLRRWKKSLRTRSRGARS